MKKILIRICEIIIFLLVIVIITVWITRGGLKRMKLQKEILSIEKEASKPVPERRDPSRRSRPTATKTSPKNKQKEAMFYRKLINKIVRCGLCFRRCTIPPGKRGFCGVRENREGILYALGYNRPCAVNIDPIEKEPVFHVHPGSEILCVATAGCSLRCRFCQNWTISQSLPEDVHSFYITSEEIVALAKRRKCIGVSFTYSEPTVFYEYMLDISKVAKKKGLKVIMHTCGVMNPEPLKELLKYMDAVTVDLKGFTDKFYKTAIPEGSLEHVLRTIKVVKESGVWLEIVNLVIPKLNDDPEDIRRMCEWIKENVGTDVPVHFNRFSPAYKLKNLPATPVKTLEKAHEIAKDVGLNYVMIGNVPNHKYNSTYCPQCGKRLIHRIHFDVVKNNISDGKCKFCGHEIPGIWQ